MLKKILFFIAVLTAGPTWATEVPKLLGHVNDYAHVLTPTDVSELNSKLDTAERNLPNNPQIVLYILPRLPDESIGMFANAVYDAWFTGNKASNGVLALYAPGSRRLYIKVGEDLIQDFTDDNVNKITGPARSYVRAGSDIMVARILTDQIVDHLHTVLIQPTPPAPLVSKNLPAQISPEFKVTQVDSDWSESHGSGGISAFIVIPGVVIMFLACLAGFVIVSDRDKTRAYKKEYNQLVAKNSRKKSKAKSKTAKVTTAETKTVMPAKTASPAKKKPKAKSKTPAKEINNSLENN